MKKILAILLAMASVMMFAISASAAEIDVEGGLAGDVEVSYVPGAESETVYSVEVKWGALEFVYNEGDLGVWNPDNLAYENPTTEEGWVVPTADGDKITVKNHSNAAVDVSFAYAAKTGYETIVFQFSVTNDTLVAVAGEGETAVVDEVTTTLSITSGTYTEAEKVTCGTVTVTIDVAA